MVLVTDGGVVGWRCWAVTSDGGLVSPIEHIIKRNPDHVTALPDSGTVTSWCRLGHSSPVSVCCGISATGHPDRMSSWLHAWNLRYTADLEIMGTLGPGQQWVDSLVVTEGAGHEPITEDSLLDFEFFRATTWTLERIHVPHNLGRRYAEGLSQRYRVPVVIAADSGMEFVAELLGEPDLSLCATCGCEVGDRPRFVGFCDVCVEVPA